MTYKGRAPFQSAAFTETQRNFTYFDRSLTSGLTDVVIESPGDFLYIDQASTGVVSVELNMRQGGTLAPILLAAGGSIECDFSSIKINASAQLSKTVRIVVGNGARIKGGANVNASSMSVSVVDGGKLRSMSNSAFLCWFGQNASGGATASHCQLFNPTANNKNIFVESIRLHAGGIQSVHVASYSTQLSSLYGYAPSKKIAGSASSAELRTQYSSGSLYTEIYTQLTATATTGDVFEPAEPLALTPGKGIVLRGTANNTSLWATFEFFEE